jgi:heat shock protein HslJ
MKSQIFIFPLALLLLMCSPSCDEPLVLESGTWQLTAITGGPAPMQIPETLPKPITIQFQDGKVKGHGGCNGYGGNYSASGDQLSVPELISTKMFCQEASNYENAFFQTLQSARSYKINGNQLEIDCGDMGGLVFNYLQE